MVLDGRSAARIVLLVAAATALAGIGSKALGQDGGTATAPGANAAIETAAPVRRFTLENGLRVVLAPSPGASSVAVVTLTGVGELHDPSGRSGMAQLMQQLLMTAPVGDVPARPAADLGRRYPQGWIGQAFADHSVSGVIVGRDRAETEVAEAIARLGSVRIGPADLDRERARLLERQRNMYDALPGYAALHGARALVSPHADGARAGGTPEQVASIELAEVEERRRRFHRPANTVLAIAGAFDADATEKRIRESAASIEPGEPIGATASRPLPVLDRSIVRRTVRVPVDPALGQAAPDAEGKVAGFAPHAAVALRQPAWSDPDSAAFVVLVARLQQLEEAEGWFDQAQAPSFLAIGLDPGTPFVFVRPSGGNPESALTAMEERLAGAAEMMPEEFGALKARLGREGAWMTGEAPITAAIIDRNPYGAAMALARQWQGGLDPAARARALRELDLGSLFAAGRRIFDPSKCARVVVTPEPMVVPESDPAMAP